jgi:hypothetical protein
LADSEITELSKVITSNAARWKPELRNPTLYDKNITATVTQMHFSAPNPRGTAPQELHQVTYENRTDQEQTFTIRDSKETSWAFELSITYGLKMTQSLNAKIGLEKIIELGGSVEWEVSLSTTAKVSTTVKRTFSWDMPLRVPKRSKVTAWVMVKTQFLEPDFTANVEIAARDNQFNTGKLVYVYENVSDGDWWRTNLSWWVAIYGWPPNFYAIDGDRVGFRTRGKIRGTWGNSCYIVTEQRELNGSLISSSVLSPDPEAPGGMAEITTAAGPVEAGSDEAASLRAALGTE